MYRTGHGYIGPSDQLKSLYKKKLWTSEFVSFKLIIYYLTLADLGMIPDKS